MVARLREGMHTSQEHFTQWRNLDPHGMQNTSGTRVEMNHAMNSSMAAVQLPRQLGTVWGLGCKIEQKATHLYLRCVPGEKCRASLLKRCPNRSTAWGGILALRGCDTSALGAHATGATMSSRHA